MIDLALTFAVVLMLAGITAALTSGQPPAMRRWLWLALAEYLGCAVYQYFHGADANGYRQSGMEMARFLDSSFTWAAPELLAVLIHQPSAFDDAVIGAGTNTGSMCAAAGWVLFFVRGSPYAAQALAAGLAMFGAFGMYGAFRDAYPEVPALRLFFATVLFPSVAFWTSALHKEGFCLMGMGLLLAGWRAASNRKVRAIFYVPLGMVIVVMFRAPALPPLLLGMAAHFVVDRIRKTRGAETVIVGPLYFILGLGGVALGMVLVSRVSPDLGLDRLGDTVAGQQKAWSVLAAEGVDGGSAFVIDDPVAQTTGQQLLRAPLSFLTALFRPQIFDVTNALVLVSALEMTTLTWLLLRAFRRHGVRGIVARIQGAPFLLMCTIVTVVGCTFVGLTTRNFGTLARYRVPFLPFYGALLAGLAERTAAAAPKSPRVSAAQRKAPRRRGTSAVAPT